MPDAVHSKWSLNLHPPARQAPTPPTAFESPPSVGTDQNVSHFAASPSPTVIANAWHWPFWLYAHSVASHERIFGMSIRILLSERLSWAPDGTVIPFHVFTEIVAVKSVAACRRQPDLSIGRQEKSDAMSVPRRITGFGRTLGLIIRNPPAFGRSEGPSSISLGTTLSHPDKTG